MKTVPPLELLSQFRLNEQEIIAVQEIIEPLHLNRHDFFLKEGNECDRIGLLIEGTLYSYTTDDLAEEVVHHFYYPSKNFLLFNFDSYLRNQPSNVSIKCHQDCMMYVFDKKKVKSLFEQFPRLYQLELLTMQQHYIQVMDRLEILHCKKSEDKIKAIKQSSPEIFLYFPFTHIASHLGMHRNTFTRALSKV